MATAAENKRAKRIKILDAANRLFLDRSVAETAIDDVVKLAGVAKGTFYLYFRDKTDLLDQIVMRHTAELFMRSCAALREKLGEREMSVSDQLCFLADEITVFLRQNRKITAMLDKRFVALFTDTVYRQTEEFRADIEYLTGLLTAQGLTAERARKRLFVLTQTIGSVCCGAILDEQPYTIEEIMPSVHELIRRMTEGGGAA